VNSADTSKRRVPILFSVHSAHRGGAELRALAETRYLRRWFDLTIPVPEGPLRDEFAAEGELVPGVASLPLWGATPIRWARRWALTARDTLRLWSLIRRRGIELVVTNSAVSLSPVLAARAAGIPAIVRARDWMGSRLSSPVIALHGLLADTIVAVSETVEREIGRPRRARLVRIYPGIEIPPTPNAPPRLRPPIRLCVVATIEPRKGQDVAVEALAELRDRGIDAVLELVGREQNKAFGKRLRERVRELGLDEHVRFRGEIADVPDLVQGQDVLIAPSRAEPLGVAPIEAQALGRPVVASRVGGLPEVVLDGETGILTRPGDHEAIAGAIARLVADPVTARGMGTRGREHVTTRFAVSRAHEALHAEIDATLRKSNG
jgi:glycosyltransferase involved in cell wall biosynthesis